MRGTPGVKTILPLGIIILLLSLIILLLIIGSSFIKSTVNDYEVGIRQIAINKTYSFTSDLRVNTESAAEKFNNVSLDSDRINNIFREIKNSHKNITNIYLLDAAGNVKNSLTGEKDINLNDINILKKAEDSTYIATPSGRSSINYLYTVTPVKTGGDAEDSSGYLAVKYGINIFSNQVLDEFTGQHYKVAIFDNNFNPILWPFSKSSLEKMEQDKKIFKSEDIDYKIGKTSIENSSLTIYFFFKKHEFNTYRILAILFLLCGLYFCIYQFMVEFWNVSSARSYFENIDFEIFNHLQEGIILTNRFDRIIFANKAAYEYLSEKEITLKETTLKNILGYLGGSSTKYILRKPGKTLEIIRSPLIKNGKFLGSLVVLSESIEKAKLYYLLFTKTAEHLSDGIIFVDENNEIAAYNMMATYYLGKIEKGMHINEVNSELANNLSSDLESISGPGRVELPIYNIFAEMLPVHNENGSYAGTLIFIKDR